VRLGSPADPGALGGEGRDQTDIEPLRATLNRMLARDVPYPAAPIPAGELETLASAGYLQGLPAELEHHSEELDLHAQERLLDVHQTTAQLVGSRRYSAAVRGLQALARLHPGIPDLQYQIGMVGLRGDRLPEALASLRNVVGTRPDSPEAASLLATALARAGRLDDARLEAARAVEVAEALEPGRLASAHTIAARLAVEAGDAEAALRHATAAEQLVSSAPMRTFVEASLLARDGAPGAAAMFERAALHVRQHEGVAIEGLHLGLAGALVAEDRLPEAKEAFREEIRAFPASVDAYTGLAALYHAGDGPQAADAVMRVLLDQVPTRAAYTAAARTWMALGERGRAEAVRLEARERFRGDPVSAIRPSDRSR
jgi:tetratricopeptide (TPR) repeat protein